MWRWRWLLRWSSPPEWYLSSKRVHFVCVYLAPALFHSSFFCFVLSSQYVIQYNRVLMRTTCAAQVSVWCLFTLAICLLFSVWFRFEWRKKANYGVIQGVFVLVKFTNETQIYDLLLLLLLLISARWCCLFIYLHFCPEIEFDCSQIICKFEIQLVSQIDYTRCRISTKNHTVFFQHVSFSRFVSHSPFLSLMLV